MNPTAIVKDLNVTEELIFSFLPRLEAFVVNEFILQNAEETFRHWVVESSCLSGSCSADIPKRRAVSEGEAGALNLVMGMIRHAGWENVAEARRFYADHNEQALQLILRAQADFANALP